MSERQLSERNIIEGTAERVTPPFDLPETLLRLALGSALEGSAQFVDHLRRWEQQLSDGAHVAAGSDSEKAADRVRYALIGAMFDAQRKLRRRADVVGRLAHLVGEQVARAAEPLVEPLRTSWLADVWKVTLASEIDRLVQEGRLQEQNARKLTNRLLGATIDEIIVYLSDNRYVDQLVNSQVTQLEDNPHVDALTNDILDHLAENPEPVRRIVQGQSSGLTDELTEELRERAVSLDMVGESLVRRIFGRAPRRDLPGPSAPVRARGAALHPHDDHKG